MMTEEMDILEILAVEEVVAVVKIQVVDVRKYWWSWWWWW